MYIKELDKDYPVNYIIHNNNKAHGLAKCGRGDFDIPENTKLLIVPDAGTNDYMQCNQLVDRGIDIICLDHHEKEDWLVDSKAIIVNNQMSDKYSNKAFSGVGVTYEFLRALDDWHLCKDPDDYLDLVSFGNISDAMDIRSAPTRYYIESGIKNINNKFLKALNKAQEFSTKGEINIHNISWYWTPILNSMIRIGSLEDRDLLFRAFIETDEVFDYKKRDGSIVDEDIYTRAARLCKNIKAKQDKLRDKLFDELKADVDPDDKVVMVVADNSDPGLIGLSAMKLCDAIKKPTIVLRDLGNGTYGGSCRNYNGSPIKDFKELVNSVRLFSFAMGHANAFGTEILEENLVEAKEALNDALDNIVYDDTIYVDFILDSYDVDYEFIKTIDDSKWLYGNGIQAPVVAVRSVVVDLEDIVVMGKNGDSIAFISDGIKYCKFKLAEDDMLLTLKNAGAEGEVTLDVVGACSINEYMGKRTAQFIVQDYNIT